jgi:hypothetical protein
MRFQFLRVVAEAFTGALADSREIFIDLASLRDSRGAMPPPRRHLVPQVAEPSGSQPGPDDRTMRAPGLTLASLCYGDIE